ncbi:hypothetical protein Hanom_Chr12g01141281 [Helianthus anomalus]
MNSKKNHETTPNGSNTREFRTKTITEPLYHIQYHNNIRRKFIYIYTKKEYKGKGANKDVPHGNVHYLQTSIINRFISIFII